MRFRLPCCCIAVLFSAPFFAQRPTATFVGGSLVRLDLDGRRVFADAPLTGGKGMTAGDIALYVSEPVVAPVSAYNFLPGLAPDAQERLTNEVGEKTGIYIYPKKTPWGEKAHASYLVQWNGRRIWFSGDTQDPTELLSTQDIDVAFVTPAMLTALESSGKGVDARKVILYHTGSEIQQGVEVSAPCERCELLVPWPGEVIQLFR